MPVSETWVERLATLAADCRPSHATRWDVPGTMAAIRKVKHLALPDVARAVINAAEDRAVETPGVIANLRSACWRDRPVRPDARQTEAPAALCVGCGLTRDVCEQRRRDQRGLDPEDPRYDDHEYLAVGAARDRKRPAEAAHRTAATVKEDIRALGDRPAALATPKENR